MIDAQHGARLPRSIGSLAALIAAALVSAALLVPGVAHADTAPISPTETPSVTSDALPTTQINGVAWAQVVIGNTVYVGGAFTRARAAGVAPGVDEQVRNNILSYDMRTGELLPFKQFVNAQIRSMAASADGTRLYIGGDFTKVGDVARNRLAAISATSGAVVASFNPDVNGIVRAVKATASTVYFGGDFTVVSGVSRSRAAAVYTSTGTVTAWSPVVSSGAGVANVKGIAISPDQSRVVIAGDFATVNGSGRPGQGLAMLSATDSARTNLPLPANDLLHFNGPGQAFTSVTSDDDSFYTTSYGGPFEGVARINWSDGAIAWLDDCHGDSYSSYSTGSLIYKASHSHDCETVPGAMPYSPPFAGGKFQHALAYTKAVAGTLVAGTHGHVSWAGQPAPAQVNWFPGFKAGTYTGQDQATWHVTGSGSYVVFGGEFLEVNGTPQQGLVRFATSEVAPDRDGPRLTGDAIKPTLVTDGDDGVTVIWPSNWDRDNERLSYQVRRDGKVIATLTGDSRWYRLPKLSYLDSGLSDGQSYTYSIRVLDPAGNLQTSTTASIVAGTEPVVPVAEFTATVNGGTVTVDAGASSPAVGTIGSYDWSFGDGATGRGVKTSRSYAAAGTYPITLTVTDSRGVPASITHEVTIETNVAPIADFTFSVLRDTVSVNGLVSSDPDGSIVSYGWDFGDGVKGGGGKNGRTYASGGDYPVTLTVTDNRGATSSVTKQVTVTENLAPIATFSATVIGTTVYVGSSGSYDPDGVITSYSWNFGDGVFGSGPTNGRTYAASGDYLVTLTVTDDSGVATSFAQIVTIL